MWSAHSLIIWRTALFKFTPEQEAWLHDLETTDAEQAYSYLRTADGFCCLGRACETLGAESVYNDNNGCFEYEGEVASLSNGLQYQLGLLDPLGGFEHSLRDSSPRDENGEHVITLASLNDDLLWSFKQIAAFIRETPERVFKKSDEQVVTLPESQGI